MSAAIVGGIDVIEGGTIVVGGSHYVVGGKAKQELRRRAMALDHLKGLSTKNILAIIGMSRPVRFGVVEYDDGQRRQLRRKAGRPKGDPDEVVMDNLIERLRLPPKEIASQLSKEFHLTEPYEISMGSLIRMLLKHVRRCRPTMRTIKISGDVGHVMTAVSHGETSFKVAYDTRPDRPSDLAGVATSLIDVLSREITKQGAWQPPSITSDADWPALVPPLSTPESKEIESANVADLVRAIVDRESALIEYLDGVEEYYAEVAKNIQRWQRSLTHYLNQQTIDTGAAMDTRKGQ